MVVFESVSADLSTKFLSALSGSIEEKLDFLQGQLSDDYPNIVIQYVCGDDPNVQIKGKWPEVNEIFRLLNKWLENITSSVPSELPPLADFKEAVNSIDKEIITGEDCEDHEKVEKNTEDGKNVQIKVEGKYLKNLCIPVWWPCMVGTSPVLFSSPVSVSVIARICDALDHFV